MRLRAPEGMRARIHAWDSIRRKGIPWKSAPFRGRRVASQAAAVTPMARSDAWRRGQPRRVGVRWFMPPAFHQDA
jgi:hypothetical protein